jgi:hypothetical protein
VNGLSVEELRAAILAASLKVSALQLRLVQEPQTPALLLELSRAQQYLELLRAKAQKS